MLRYLRLYAYFLRFSFSRAMEFRFDFCFRIVMDVVWYAVHLTFLQVLFLHTPLFGGWNQDQMLVFFAALFLADALNMTVFASNMWWLPFFVNRGDLDYYLVRPVSSLFFLSLRDFAANSFVNLLMTVGFMGFVLFRYPGELGGLRIALFLSLLVLGVVLHYLMELVFLVPVFWMHQGSGLRDVFSAMKRYSTHPDGIYQGWVRRLLVSVLPFALISSFPTRALFDPDPLPVVLHMLGVIAVMAVVANRAWSLGLRSYSSASS